MSFDSESGPSWARANWPIAELDELNLGLDPTQASIEKVKAAVAYKRHCLGAKPQKMKRTSRGTVVLAKADGIIVKRNFLPYG